MKVQLKRNGEKLDCDKVVIFVDDKEFRFVVDIEGRIVITKQADKGSSGVVLSPIVSNQIAIS